MDDADKEDKDMGRQWRSIKGVILGGLHRGMNEGGVDKRHHLGILQSWH